jgi:aminotransferase
MKPINPVVEATPPSGIRRFFDVAAQMEDVISLGVGEPDVATPWRIREAGIFSLERGQTTYTSNSGLSELRERISRTLYERNAVYYDPSDEVLVTVGVSQGLDLVMRALLAPGDEVVYFEPSYVSYPPVIRFAGGVPVPVATRGEDGFRTSAEALRQAITPRTKAILLCNPSNPLGSTMSRAELIEIVEAAQEHDLYIIADEIYSRLTYGVPHVSLPSIEGARERTILLDGFSKTYAMTGWRVGYACAPRGLLAPIARIHQYTMLCAPHTAQRAAIEALDNAEREVQEMVRDYDRRRRMFVAGLNEIGLDCHEPTGAFYAFPSIRRTGLTSNEFADRLLMEERVAAVPGTAFGESGEGYVRCSYATGMAQLEEALRRMSRFMERCGENQVIGAGASSR